ncbi:carboxypeptidase regulatory-like domain-containing protein [Leptolyngbya sp. NIES-2104]|uniref:carboxypeptidase regulatory-like domain-containing protein n=1 Tax=Leptolyngbya sp. NIES-2104 TaxID=1552121 RepID=UPI0006EC50FC|nr:hypothetical protein NIES2104_18090 [Leptolyngbya sp. NIES-2104]
MSGTTTLKQLQDDYRRNYYNIRPIEPFTPDPTTPKLGTNALEKALESLEKREIDALASDAPIVQSFLEEGVAEGGKQGEMNFVRGRSAFKNQGFAVFPSREFKSPDNKEYLPRTDRESYAMAVRAGTNNTNELRRLIDDALSDLNKPETTLRKAQDYLKTQESLNPQNSPSQSNSSPTNPTGSTTDQGTKGWWKEPGIVAALVAAFASIVVAVLNPQFVGAIISTIRSWIQGNTKTPQRADRRIIGRVLNDVTNIGIEGAQVILETGSAPLSRSTDSNGYFFFSFQSTRDEVRVCVDANGYTRFDQLINLADEQEITKDIKLSPLSISQLRRNRTIVGRVVNNSKFGIKGARVILEAQGVPQVTNTDENGYFFFSFQSSKDTVRVIVESNGHRGSETLVPLLNDEENTETRVTISLDQA